MDLDTYFRVLLALIFVLVDSCHSVADSLMQSYSG